MVTVHYFRRWDINADDYLYSRRKRTAEGIKAIGCEIVPGTAEEVDEASLDAEGRYEPRRPAPEEEGN